MFSHKNFAPVEKGEKRKFCCSEMCLSPIFAIFPSSFCALVIDFCVAVLKQMKKFFCVAILLSLSLSLSYLPFPLSLHPFPLRNQNRMLQMWQHRIPTSLTADLRK
jgi:hypothetical protein